MSGAADRPASCSLYLRCFRRLNNPTVNQGAQAAAGAYAVLTKQGGRLPNVVVMRPKLLTKQNLNSVTSWADQLTKIKAGSLTR